MDSLYPRSVAAPENLKEADEEPRMEIFLPILPRSPRYFSNGEKATRVPSSD